MRRKLCIASLLIVLAVTPVIRSEAEDTLATKYQSYIEEDNRVEVQTASFAYKHALNSFLDVNITGVYDSISGTSPTGLPAPTQTKANPYVEYYLLKGHFPTPKELERGKLEQLMKSNEVPTAYFEDERFASTLSLTGRTGRHTFTGGLSMSTESDYHSWGGDLNWGIDFNKKNTTVNMGLALTHDTVGAETMLAPKDKDTWDILVGVSQILDKNTVVTANLTLGFSHGYLNDPYRYAEVDGIPMAESRPDDRERQVAMFTFTHYFEKLQGSLDASYRYYQDSWDVSAHTVELAWRQKITQYFVLEPLVRVNEQSEAKFYNTLFETQPGKRLPYFSSDWRLSELRSYSYGAKLVWTPKTWIAIDGSYERYMQEGTDGKTKASAYPSADVFSVGASFKF